MLLTYEQMGDLLEEIAAQFPDAFFEELDGGIQLEEQALPDPDFPPGEMYIMGEYCRSHMMGRHINIYFGSMNAAYGHCSDEEMKAHIRSTIFHEFRHHLESLGGSRELEREDAVKLADYFRRHRLRDNGEG